MPLTQEDIREAEAQTLVLRRQLATLRQQAMKDNVITPSERAEIDQVSRNIDRIRNGLNQSLSKLPDDELADMRLTQPDADQVYTEEYMSDLRDASFEGGDPPTSYEGNENLRTVMRDIGEGELTGKDRDTAMQQLAAIMGEPPSASELDADYGRFLVIRQQQEAVRGENAEELDEDRHSEFLGSRSQLIFGRVMGDTFGINEVFGAMLSPTGGLVGADNSSVQLDPDDPIALHGTVHDAAGYMRRFHDEGPGYNYRDDKYEAVATSIIELMPQGWQDELLPLTGQISGIAWWMEETDTDVEEYAEEKFDQAVVWAEEQLEEARDAVATEVSERLDAIEQGARDLLSGAVDTAQTVGEEIVEFAEGVGSTISEGVQDFGEGAREIGEAVQSGAAQAAQSAVEAYETVSEGVGNIAEAAGEKLDALADLIWG